MRYKDFGKWVDEMEETLRHIPAEKKQMFAHIEEIISYYRKQRWKP